MSATITRSQFELALEIAQQANIIAMIRQNSGKTFKASVFKAVEMIATMSPDQLWLDNINYVLFLAGSTRLTDVSESTFEKYLADEGTRTALREHTSQFKLTATA